MLDHDHPDSLVERRINEAIAAGEFDDLPGAGRPFTDAGRAYDDLWWVRRWMERNQLDARPLFLGRVANRSEG